MILSFKPMNEMEPKNETIASGLKFNFSEVFGGQAGIEISQS